MKTHLIQIPPSTNIESKVDSTIGKKSFKYEEDSSEIYEEGSPEILEDAVEPVIDFYDYTNEMNTTEENNHEENPENQWMK